jgi:hypothetical protein
MSSIPHSQRVSNAASSSAIPSGNEDPRFNMSGVTQRDLIAARSSGSILTTEASLNRKIEDYDSLPQTRTNDTRRFSRFCLPSLHGYEANPHIIDGLGSPLLESSSYTGRLVQIGSRCWEAWSPNSKHNPYYPGKAEDSFNLETPSRLEERCTDGHLGRFDPTVSPPWWGFIRRCITDLSTFDQFPEFDVVHTWWTDEPTQSVHRGTLSIDLVS